MTSEEIIKKSRIDFTAGVPETLFRKVNGQCSVPRCDKPTTGPFVELGSAVNMGVACHIYSAAKDGPRGRGGKSDEFIRSESNGIWCCQYHASLIDKKKGIDYPATTLFAWKDLAEARLRKKMNDIPSPLGWVESIELSGFRFGQALTTKISLSRYTLISGENDSGKTALLEASAAICNSKYFSRIASNYTKSNGDKVGNKARATTTYTTVDAFSNELTITADNFVIRRKNGHLPCLLPPGDIEVIFCSESDVCRLDSEDDVALCMRVLAIDRSALHELVEIGAAKLIDGTLHFQNVTEEDELGKIQSKLDEYGKQCVELVLRRKTSSNESFDVTYSGLSTSEQRRLLLALSITKAREVAKQKLTLLAIEVLANNFDGHNFKILLEVLRDEKFQVVISIPPALEKAIIYSDGGVVRLQNLDYLHHWTLQVLSRFPNATLHSLAGPQ